MRTTPVAWRALVGPRDRHLTDAGFEGELLVARARLVIAGIVCLVPIRAMIESPVQHENWVGMSMATVMLFVSLGVLRGVTRGWRPWWIGFATSLFDVTIISCALITLGAVGVPHIAVNSRTTFEVYFLAIAATCLRYDARVCLTAGVVAAAEYTGIVLFTTTHWDLNADAYAPFPYGMYSPTAQFGRVVLMLGATLLSVMITRRSERLRELSTHDLLTGLYNRAYFVERLEEELVRTARYGRSLSVALIDLDHFKAVNDRWGHSAGDAALKAVARLLRADLRRSDIIARYGGEEFAMIFPETSGEEAVGKLDRMRAQLAATDVDLGNGSRARISFSGGMACTPADGVDAMRLVAAADGRLLQAKAGGRDRVVAAPTPSFASAD